MSHQDVLIYAIGNNAAVVALAVPAVVAITAPTVASADASVYNDVYGGTY